MDCCAVAGSDSARAAPPCTSTTPGSRDARAVTGVGAAAAAQPRAADRITPQVANVAKGAPRVAVQRLAIVLHRLGVQAGPVVGDRAIAEQPGAEAFAIASRGGRQDVGMEDGVDQRVAGTADFREIVSQPPRMLVDLQQHVVHGDGVVEPQRLGDAGGFLAHAQIALIAQQQADGVAADGGGAGDDDLPPEQEVAEVGGARPGEANRRREVAAPWR